MRLTKEHLDNDEALDSAIESALEGLSGSSPLKCVVGLSSGGVLGAQSATASAIAWMCSGVVPQQPPTMLSQPLRAKSPSTSAMCSGVSSYSPKAFGRPAFG